MQVRTGSTRLPGKMLMPFHDGRTIPEIMIDQVCRVLPPEQVVVATTTQERDFPLVEMAERLGVNSFRGDEEDVLRRFGDATRKFGFTHVFRICSDNPFLRADYLQTLLDAMKGSGSDYITFQFPDETPIMKSHIGLFAEIMTADFLFTLEQRATDQVDRENVTTFVYPRRNEFNTVFIPVPEEVENRRDIRLTIDRQSDFDVAQEIYTELHGRGSDWSVAELVTAIDSRPERLDTMKNEIARNTK